MQLLQGSLTCSSLNIYRLDTLQSAVSLLQAKMLPEVQEFHIRRNHVLHDVIQETKKRTYSPMKKVSTYFVGEAGKDEGGLTRELWSLFANAVEQLCDGQPMCKIFRHDAAKLQVHAIVTKQHSF